MRMCDQRSRLAALLLSDLFGPVVGAVASDLLGFGTKTLGQITASSGQSVKDVRSALAVLIHHGLVTFNDKRRPTLPDYTLEVERVLAFVRHPQYLYLVKSTFGDECEALMEELLKAGCDSASALLCRTAKRLNASLEDASRQVSLYDLAQQLERLAQSHLIVRCPAVATGSGATVTVPVLTVPSEAEMFSIPKMDIKALTAAVLSGEELGDQQADSFILWRLNLDRLNQLLRDREIEKAAAMRLDRDAGNVVKSILSLISSLYDPWAAVSGHLGYQQIVDRVKKDWGATSQTLKYLDQYLQLLSSDRHRFVDKVGSSGGGQYTLNLYHIIEQLASATLDKIVLEKYGSKSVRIFRYIREKRYVEENSVQQAVMIPAKEAKLITYQLIENNLVHQQELRKSLVATAPSKSVNLFYINLDQVARTCLSDCYKALYNLRVRADHETEENVRLLEKYEKVDTILASLKASGGTQEQLDEVNEMLTPPEKEAIAVLQSRLQHFQLAQSYVDQTLFSFQTYLYFRSVAK